MSLLGKEFGGSETISIVIPTKNEGNAIEECLTSILNQSVSPFEVIIVDGGSSDNTLDLARKFKVKIIHEGSFSSPANARNLGVENAKGSIVLIIDADVVLQEDCLKYAIECFKDKDVIVVNPSGVYHAHSYLEAIQLKWDRGMRRPSALAFFFRKGVFEEVKFDTALGFGEDYDFNNKLEKKFKDFRIVVAKNCRVLYHAPHSINEFVARYTWWGRTFKAYLIKHFCGKTLLNMCSLLLPTAVIVVSITTLFFSQLLPVLFVLSLLLFAKILIVSIRSRFCLFIHFILFDIFRSFLFTIGIIQSFFVKRKGR